MSSEEKQLSWYAVQVATGFESKMIQEIASKISLEGLGESFGDMVVPTEEVIELKNGKKRKVVKKLIPGYIFIQMDMNDEAWFLVRNATKVLGFLGAKKGKKPLPMPANEVENMLNRDKKAEEDKPRLSVVFDYGELVRVSSGPFADFQGSVEDIIHEKQRLVVSVMIFGRSTPVELEFGQVEKIT
ncbi:transcription termination/antitermination protein NusG [Candidatus Synchoanobacter obligatus]|uniref:Transcription termination/antitermination protein NusG n=1 Tax=Candidatus Synchoanobacter obligatus TaxID=2919597 RepID=A0ABT1L5V8_9GAMM|nr:transcription termination/antitermination protein NusG [Candidatus Synchoanobacter obligatus]MCP8352474.1 transcription termination/antitermination protein NusG [Candidatus Synchoanobacter obligatus]